MGIVDLLFPKNCLGCGRAGRYLCRICVGKLKKAKQICIECERPAIDGMTHARCRRPWGLSGVFSIWTYQGAIRKTLIKLKYKFVLEIAEELAEHICFYLQKEKMTFSKGSLLVPVPLHRRRKNWRGFNQVEEIGKLVCEKMSWQFAPDILVRKKSKRPQTELKGDARKENIRGVFAFNSDCRSLFTDHRSLILFDDVLTTGATIKEAAKVLKRNGAGSVWGLTIAK